MEMLIKTILLIFITTSFVNAAAARTFDWVGIYTFDEESLDMDRNRTSYWFRLEIMELKGKLIGIYADGINGQTKRRFQLTVKLKGKKARFYYDRGLCRNEDLDAPLPDNEFVDGELMFEFEETAEKKNGQPVIYTIWKKINSARQTESGRAGKKSIFFRKV